VQLTARDRTSIAASVFEKLRADALVSERLGAEAFWSKIGPLWPEGAPHLAVSELAEWFAAYPYLPKLRDKVVLERAVADLVGQLDAKCAFATGFDSQAGRYEGLTYAKAAPAILPASALLVRKSAYDAQAPQPAEPSVPPSPRPSDGAGPVPTPPTGQPVPPAKPKRFYGSVELDPLRPIKSLEAIIDAVVMQLQHSGSAKVRLTLDIEAETDGGFDDADISVVRDNCQQLKFKSDSTGFE
jgi:hypothetical protein